MDNLGLVEAIDSFREGIVVTIANTAARRLNIYPRVQNAEPRRSC